MVLAPRRQHRWTTEWSTLSQDRNQRLDYLNNRHYDPTTGTFISVDPLVISTMKPYIYGAANPVTLSDPSGLAPWHWFFGWGNYVHALIEQQFIADNSAAMHEVSYQAGGFVSGRWDLVDLADGQIQPYEIRPAHQVGAAAEEIAGEVALFNGGGIG